MVACLFSCVTFQSISIASNLDNISVYTEEYPPYNYRDKNGQLKGIAIDLLVNAHEYANIDFDKNTIKLRPWSKAYKTVLDRPNTLLFSMTRTEERENLFKWAGPISKTKVVLLAKKSKNIIIDNISDISKYSIGGIYNDIGLALVTDITANKGQIRPFLSAKAISKMLNLGRIDLWAYEENVAKDFLKRLNLDLDDFEAVYTLSNAELYFAFNINTDQIVIDNLQSILDRYRAAQ
jgi:ABC-type amino acid transport substrate-binding protein